MTNFAAPFAGPASQGVPALDVQYQLRLYVAGSLPNSVQALENLRALCERYLEGRYTLEVIDFLERPERAMLDRVVVTPTLVRVSPEPKQIVVGTLADTATVLRALRLPEQP